MPRWYAGRSVARPAYYDRDPIPIFAAYNGVVTPATSIVRATYTAPDGYAAFIEQLFLAMTRLGVASVGGVYTVWVEFLPFYGGTIRAYQLHGFANALQTAQSIASSNYGYMAYGDVIRLVTYDESTGGAVNFIATIKGTEFLY